MDTITFQATAEELNVLDELCIQLGLTKQQVLRQALRLYQSVQLGTTLATPVFRLPMMKEPNDGTQVCKG